MRSLAVMLVVALAGCGLPAPEKPKPIPKAPAGSCDTPSSSIAGDVEGTLCGNLTATDALHIAAGKKLVLGAGTVLTMPASKGITVDGELDLSGTKAEHVVVAWPQDASGWSINGTLNATFTEITGSGFGAGLSVSSTGTLSLTDTLYDQGTPSQSPDCIPVEGGTVTLDHAKITGCHCPLHVDSGTTITTTNTILDGADPIMVAHASIFMHQTSFHYTEAGDLYDLGGAITSDLAGNYYGGGAPTIFPPGDGNFGNTSNFSTTPLTDVGPRF
jgi:hypothetical protein